MPDVSAAADIAQRLRAMAGPNKPNLCDQAADLIEQMAEERSAKADKGFKTSAKSCSVNVGHDSG